MVVFFLSVDNIVVIVIESSFVEQIENQQHSNRDITIYTTETLTTLDTQDTKQNKH
jgi:hypothetical protein